MAWVRYDDGFHDHDKVAVVRAEAPEALALHLLANTWTSRTDRPGFVPSAIPTVLVGATKGRRWTALLVRSGLWVEVDGGWEFYNHAKYRAPSARQTPGTPADLSAKRAAAGAKGGKRTATKRQANGAANAAKAGSNDEQGSSKPRSPVVASNEATPGPDPVPPSAGADDGAERKLRAVRDGDEQPTAQIVVAAYVDELKRLERIVDKRAIGKVAQAAGQLVSDGAPVDVLIDAAKQLASNGYTDLGMEARKVQADRVRRPPQPKGWPSHLPPYVPEVSPRVNW